DPLVIPQSLTRGGILQRTLEGYFEQVLKIDYETIYTTDFIDAVAFPDSKEVVTAITNLADVLRRYDFSSLGFDIIGRIFERLIPQDERHILGQYFTNPDIVDLILRFCLQHEDDKVLDPACGAGTFLVRAYQHKKLMNQRLSHEEILETLWGNDIAKFPAHLATINLAICDLSVDQNYPNIIQEDFFALQVGNEGFELPDRTRKRRAMTLGKSGREVTYPRWFDVVVGNPPYTRQEEIPETGVDKARLIQNALMLGNRKLADISRRAGIHAYFFVHGFKFLHDGGRFGFIVSNSWLDVDYGKGLQEFFLKNYKIVAIIESKVERWFEDADINTCIVILEKCADKRQRDSNLVRFVYLKKLLRNFIPPAQDIWEQQLERLRAIDQLKRTILAHDSLYENDELRVFPVRQAELWAEGYDSEEREYVGAKWGKYLRAPAIFFKVLEKGKGKLVPLKQIAKVRRGFTTGANEFFYLTEEQIKRWKIEREFWMHKDEKGRWVPNYVIKSPRECRSILVKPEDLKFRVLLIHKDKDELKGTNVLRYINAGERKGYHKRPTCASRKRWYDLGERRAAEVNFNYLINDVARVFSGRCFVSDDFHEIHTRTLIAPYLNSSVCWFFENLLGRTSFGGGLLKIQAYELGTLPVCVPDRFTRVLSDVFRKVAVRPVESIFIELGADTREQVSLNKVKPDRRELDKIIMGEILGLTEEEQLEVYRAVVDLVRSRLERAKSVAKGSRTREGVDMELFSDRIIKQVKEDSGQ
ncbi:MAG: N-6 DNA methylase, partial [candidate division WOR-3 bacterium]